MPVSQSSYINVIMSSIIKNNIHNVTFNSIVTIIIVKPLIIIIKTQTIIKYPNILTFNQYKVIIKYQGE
jgi:hypothetical protein